MDRGKLSGSGLSARQLSVAAFVAGLAPAAAAAGRVSWMWLALWAAVGTGMGWLVLRRVKGRAMFQGPAGGLVSALYRGWAAVLMADILLRAARRVEATSGGENRTVWLILLMALPLLRLGWEKTTAFFRAAELFWLAMAAVLAAVAVLGVVQIEWRYVLRPSGDWRSAGATAVNVMTPFLFVLPYIYDVSGDDGGERGGGRGLVWLGALGVVSAALSLFADGILGDASGALREPFFAAAGLLGKTARCEGLLSVLWLIPDLTAVGLLSRVWGEVRWPGLAIFLAALLAAVGIPQAVSALIYPLGTVALLVLTIIFPGEKRKNSS